ECQLFDCRVWTVLMLLVLFISSNGLLRLIGLEAGLFFEVHIRPLLLTDLFVEILEAYHIVLIKIFSTHGDCDPRG
ncbi:hypothetical protein RA269_28400, partial [Pseudomonas syringae pv. tagetis]|uniref:hypothetical protein n=1 Tax=Pseudomonas syringae group genomosp. 7 TaxID=251699 RepID=UPI00376FB1E6